MKKEIIFIVILIAAGLLVTPTASAQTFGKNKKQYQEFDWKYIESDHFDIYYNSGNKPLAEFAAFALEHALASIQQTLNYSITARVPVIVYESHNDFQQTNVIDMYISQGIGGVTELYKNRVVVPFQGNYSQYRHVLHHELVHAVINDMFYGGTFQTAISTSGIAQIPLWINEGLAEYESLGGMDFDTDMYLRDLTMNEALPNLKDIYGYNAYRLGQSFFYFIELKYGKEKITEFMSKLKAFKGVEPAFINTFGLGLDDFSELWQTEIKKRYWPDITAFQSPKEFATPITNHEKDDCYYYSSPAIAPSGDKMAFISDRDGGLFAVYTAKTDEYKEKDFKPKKLVSSARQLDFEQLNILTPSISWTPDSKKIVISAKAGGEDAIFIIDEQTADYERILLGMKSITSVSCAPNGQAIAFVGVKEHQSDIFIYNIEQKTITQLTADVFTDTYPAWTPNSDAIYFISDRGQNLTNNSSAYTIEMWEHNYETSDVYKIDITTKQIEQITNTPNVKETCIAVAPDNSKLLLVANETGISNVFQLNLNDSQPAKPITNSANAISQIAVTPEGLNLILAAQVKGGYDVFMMKNPLEKRTLDSVPLTKFKLQQTSASKTNDSTSANNLQQDTNQADQLISYGKFTTNFEQQQFLQPNQDAIKLQNQAQEPIEINPRELSEKDYSVNFSLDAVMVNPAVSTFYGVQGAAGALFSDIMSNHQIYAAVNILSTLKNSQVYAAYFYNPKLIDYSAAFYNNSIFTWNYVSNPEAGLEDYYIYSYRATGLILGASYPLNLFERLELNFNLVNAAKENSDVPSYESINKFFFVPEVKYVLDNTLNGIYAPTRGSRLFVKAMYSPKLGSLSSEFITITTDIRHYIELIPNFMSLAFRGSIGASFGSSPQHFYIGGIENWFNATYRYDDFYLDQPEDFAFMNAWVMPMRGWPVLYQSGTKYAVANIEYRFPLLLAFGTGGLPLIIQGIMGNVFCDIGTTFTDIKSFRISHIDPDTQERHPGNLLMSLGTGIRAIVFGLPFKFDVAWRNEYSGWSSPYYLFSIGFDF